VPTFAKTGIDQAKAAADAANAGGANFFRLKTGQVAFFRPYLDVGEILTVEMHGGVKTKPAPKGAQKWPAAMGAVCQNDAIFRIYGDNGKPVEPPQWEEGYGGCYIHLNYQNELDQFKKPVSQTRPQTWGVFVMRKPLRKVGGQLVALSNPLTERPDAFEDEMTDFKLKSGELVSLPRLVYVTQSYNNFWDVLAQTVYMDGTWTNRDFRVTREDNEYKFNPSPEDRKLFPGSDAWKRYEEAARLRGIDIATAIVDQANPKYYGRFFDPSYKDEEADGESQGAGASDDQAAEATPEAVADVRSRMAETFGTKDPLATQPV
jgi:hypothetical protein